MALFHAGQYIEREPPRCDEVAIWHMQGMKLDHRLACYLRVLRGLSDEEAARGSPLPYAARSSAIISACGAAVHESFEVGRYACDPCYLAKCVRLLNFFDSLREL